MVITLPLVLVLVVLLGLSALFSMSEAAFLAINKVRLRHLMQRGTPAAHLVYHLLAQLDRLIVTILVSDSLVNVILSVLGTVVCVTMFGLDQGPVIATLVLTTVLLVVGDIAPKLFAASHADRLALVLAVPLQWLIRLMRPLVWLFTGVSQGLIRLVGGQRLSRSPLVTEEELKVMIEMGREAGVLAEGELRMLHRIFEFEDTAVKDVMVSRDQIAAVEIASTPEVLLDVLVEEGHSRIPVYRGSLDQIEGIIYARDLLAIWRHGKLFALPDLLHPPYLVPETKRVAELLRDFQRLHVQIAMVQSDARRTVGLVTLEDVLEEIVGELDEHIPQRTSSSLP